MFPKMFRFVSLARKRRKKKEVKWSGINMRLREERLKHGGADPAATEVEMYCIESE